MQSEKMARADASQTFVLAPVREEPGEPQEHGKVQYNY